MTNERAKWELEHIYGMVAPDVQRALDVALKGIKALEVLCGDGCKNCEYATCPLEGEE